LTDPVRNAWFSSAVRELMPYAPGAAERALLHAAAFMAKRRNLGHDEEIDTF
jgi:hypothetical protein